MFHESFLWMKVLMLLVWVASDDWIGRGGYNWFTPLVRRLLLGPIAIALFRDVLKIFEFGLSAGQYFWCV